MLAGLVVGIILGVVAACILITIAYRYLYLRKQRKTTQIFHLPPPVTTTVETTRSPVSLIPQIPPLSTISELPSSIERSLESPRARIPPMPAMAELPTRPIPVVPHIHQNFASEVPAPVVADTEPTTPLSLMFSPYTTSTTPFSELANPIVQTAAVRTPHFSEQPRATISRNATELHLEPSPDSAPGSRPFSPATMSSSRASICETPVLGTAVAFNVSEDSLPRYSMIRIDGERARELSPPRTAYIPYRPPRG